MIVLILPDVSVDDARLVRAQNNDQEAITEIYLSYYEAVYQFVRLRVGDEQVAEDLTSDIFVKFIKAIKAKKAPHTSLRGWIFQVARNLINDYFGKAQPLPAETLEQWFDIEGDPNPEIAVFQTVEAERIRQAISQLLPSQQEVLLLRFDQQLSLQETADVMGKNPNAIKALQFRAVTALREILLKSETKE
jgi:RNA polymerase sigma-70 factor (ECF subfamily)